LPSQKFLERVKLANLLSYGPSAPWFKLERLNVLIGPNASGKSNLIEALSLLAATPRDLAEPLRRGGGVSEWIWKGGSQDQIAEIEAVLTYPNLHYYLSFTAIDHRLWIRNEAVRNAFPGPKENTPHSYYEFKNGRPVIDVRFTDQAAGRERRPVPDKEVSREQSILSERKDTSLYPELTYLGREFGRIRFYRYWDLSRGSVLRRPQQSDLPNDFLAENGENLGLVINALQNRPDVKRALLANLRLLWEAVEDVQTTIQGGTVQIFFHERGFATPVPISRLSDGTLRFLCLLAILCHPEPPPLVCIEEPELGLHPDAVATVAKLLVDAASRTQLVVTTHSDALVSALSEVPESVVVCERTEAGTSLRRLEAASLERWLESYRLGELWRMGEIGGTRW
jgi:predicted ATPase